MKRLIMLSAVAFMLAAIFPISAGAGDDGAALTANQLDLRVFGESTPPGSEFWMIFQIMPPSYVDSVEVRYQKTGEFTKFRTNVLEGPRPLLSPSMLPIIRGGPTIIHFFADIPFGDTSGILLSVYYKGTPVDSMGMSFYREGDSVVFSRKTFPPPPEPPRDPRLNRQYPLSFILEPAAPLHLPGKAELRFIITPKWYYDSLYIDVNPIGNLTYFGNPRYTVPTGIGETSEFILPISIPPNDTSALEVEINSDQYHLNAIELYFVTTNDTVEVYKSKPIGPRVTPPHSHESPRPYNPLFTQLAPATLPVLVGDLNLKFNIRPGEKYDSILFKVIPLGNIQYHGDSVIYVPTDTGQMNEYLLPVTIPPDDTTGVSLTVISGDHIMYGYAIFFVSTRDSVGVEYTNPAPGKLKIERPMRIIPLPTDRDQKKPSIQILEPPAHPKKPKTDDSILGTPRKTPDGQRMMIAPPGNNPERFGINQRSNMRHTAIGSHTPPPPLNKSGQWDSIYAYGFENGLGPYFYATDIDNNSGLDYWDTISVYESWGRASDGFYSAWCSRIGSRPVPNLYETYMDSWLSIGFILPGFEDLIMEFDIWYSTEYDYDGCIPYYSVDGEYWDPVDNYQIYMGTYGSWKYNEQYAINFAGHDTVWIAFRFISGNVNNYEGVFIDNFRLWGWNDALPDLTAAQPEGWDGPIVPNWEENTNYTEELYAFKRTYVDFCVANIGQGYAAPFAIAILLDGVPIDTLYSNDTLPPNHAATASDIMYIIPDGSHQLAMDIDCFDQVVETDPTNNYYSEYFSWDSAYINVQAWVQYRDMSFFGGAIMNGRRLIAELWDANAAYPAAKISSSDDTIYTNDNGFVDFGQVANYDTEGFLDEIDPFIKFYAENPAARLFANPFPSGPIYWISTDTAINTQIDVNTNIIADSIESRGFFIVDCLLQGYDKWHALRQSDYIMKVDVNLSDSITAYETGMNHILVDTSVNDTLYRPDTFDRDIIIEEYGHKLSRDFFIFDQGFNADHWWFSKITLDFGAAEAFSYFWSFLTRGSTIITNKWHNYTEYYTENAENGEYIRNGQLIGSANDSGITCEGAIACLLWDMYDDVDDDYDGDSVGDIFSAGINTMLNVMTQYNPDNTQEFWSAWINNGYDHNHEMWALWYEHGKNMDTVDPVGEIKVNGGVDFTTSLIVDLELDYTDTLSGLVPPRAQMNLTNNIAYRPTTGYISYTATIADWDLSDYGGNSDYGAKVVGGFVTDAAGNTDWSVDTIEYVECLPGDANGDFVYNLGDAVYIINYIFKGGPPPTPYPLASGDFNGDCACNIGDPPRITDFVFKGGPPPVDCDTWVANCGRPIRK